MTVQHGTGKYKLLHTARPAYVLFVMSRPFVTVCVLVPAFFPAGWPESWDELLQADTPIQAPTS